MITEPSLYDSLTPAEAIAMQQELRRGIDTSPLEKPIGSIGGADISFNKFSETVYAGIVILSFPEMKIIDRVSVISKARFPYIPGLLAFREVPALLEVWNKLTVRPDVLVLDGHGISHPRRMGIATHFGLVAGIPSIGCAKSLLTGKYTGPDNIAFAQSPLLDKDEQIGIVLRTKRNCNPVYISPGNGISMQQSVDIIKQCTGKYRIPEPTRQAHLLVNEIRLNAGSLPATPTLFD